MYSKTIVLAAISALFATQAIGASINVNARSVSVEERAALIAADPVAACNCPGNCKHKNGDSCKFYENGNTLSGQCVTDGDHLKCVA
ncbi:hypothetical protein P280DRAFT_514471 [Massarina eburnea CBS 473.64]|uniref:Uncharacterized protein n=1 Tax=Massarina eburnea CBS 473.64 TaxID=1395130 RepID=A0A6A6SE97_9PLEO|nr:hypothetical protein P280DRAFT_514471 [Massarina eburnea CBS 473.64]